MTPIALIAITVLAPLDWKPVAPGTTYTAIRWHETPAVGDGILHVVRMDPSEVTLAAHSISLSKGEMRTAAQWGKEQGLAVVINAGMFETDYSKHTGYLRIGEHKNNPLWVTKYHSVLAFGHKKAGLPAAVMIDRDAKPDFNFDDYEVVVQNLRLIKAPGKNRWAESDKRWSEAAIAMDHKGRLLFVFSRTPYTMREFNRRLLALDLGVRQAMHVEGGPEASLSIHGGGIDLDLAGSFETGFNADDSNTYQWQLPNVIGVRSSKPD